MFPQPAFSNGVIEPGAVLLGRAAFLEQEWPVDLLNVDAPALQRLGRVGDLQQLARATAGSANGLGATYFMRLPCAADYFVRFLRKFHQTEIES